MIHYFSSLGRRRRGFSLVELCIVLAVLAVLGSLAVPAAARSMARQRVVAAAQHLVADIAQARYEAARQGLPMHVETQAGANWCWAVTTQPGCGCEGHLVCRLKVTRKADHPGVSLQAAHDLALNADGSSDPTAAATLQAGDWQIRVEVGAMGRARLCTPGSEIAGIKRC